MCLCPGCHATAGQHVTHKRTKWGSCGHLSSLVLLTFTLKLCLNSYKWKQQRPKIWAGISRFNPNKGSINKNIQQTDRKACHGFLLLSILCSIAATSKHTLQKNFPQWTLTLFDWGCRKGTFSYLCTMAISRTQSCSISSAQCCGFIWMVGADKVRVKFPLEGKKHVKKRSMRLTSWHLPSLIARCLSKKWGPLPKRAPIPTLFVS